MERKYWYLRNEYEKKYNTQELERRIEKIKKLILEKIK